MSYHNEQYLNSGNILVGGVRGGAVLVNGRSVIPTTVDVSVVDAEFKRMLDESVQNNPGWRAPAWWYNARLENAQSPTHHAGYLPLALVKDKLFGWSALESVKLIAHVELADGRVVEVPVTNHKALIREDRLFEGMDETGFFGNAESVLSVMGKDYGTHQPQELFIEGAAELVGGADSINITGAGLLKWGRVAYMELSVPQEMHNDAVGFGYRPNLLFYTSFDGSLKTTIGRTITATVCDNTLQIAASEAERAGAAIAVPHTRLSLDRLREMRGQLGLMIEQEADAFDKMLVEWSQTPVTGEQFVNWLDEVKPIPEIKVIDGKTKTNSVTSAIRQRDALAKLYTTDERAATWVGTKLGVRQAWNTFNQHEAKVMGAKALGGNVTLSRVESNLLKSMKLDRNGESAIAVSDAFAMEKLDAILANA